jgi:hypothetical protein
MEPRRPKALPLWLLGTESVRRASLGGFLIPLPT